MIKNNLKHIQRWGSSVHDQWKRLSVFHRTALGILCAILLVWAVREQVLDRMQRQLKDLNDRLEKDGAPVVVPPLEQDNEVQESQMLLENLHRAIEAVLSTQDNIIAARPPLRTTEKSEALNTISAMIQEANLFLEEARELACAAQPLPASEHEYVLSGSYASIFRFFELLREYPHPCQVHRISIALPQSYQDPAGSMAPVLDLSFHLRLYYYDGDTANGAASK